jgi:putative SOS response-associated peptidase YedK
MCTNYVASTRQEIAATRLGVIDLPHEAWPDEIYPGYAAPILLRGEGAGASTGSVAGASEAQAVRCKLARFGLVPRWCKDAAQARDMGRKTYNARSETASEKPSYRAPWQARQWALAPMRHFFEPCWEDAAHNGGRAVRWQIGRSDGAAFAVAGLWESWCDPHDGTLLDSFTLLTVNADGHSLMGRMHRPGEEKRMLVLVDETHYRDWLWATPQSAAQWMRAWPAEDLRGHPAPPQHARSKVAAADSPQPPQNLSLF